MLSILRSLRRQREKGDGLPQDLQGPLGAECQELMQHPGYPYQTPGHCEDELIPTPAPRQRVVRYSAVDDVGRAINPMILHGQTHGGMVRT